jgi:type IV secretory pathway TraG/TraD family ATPase VirD4
VPRTAKTHKHDEELTNFIKQHYVVFVALGLMYLWLVAGLTFTAWTHASEKTTVVLGIVGGLVASASALAVFFYVSFLEGQVARPTKRNQGNEADARFWQEQSQRAIAELEKARSTRID